MTQPQAPVRKLLAVDPGSRRIGIAVSDELGMFAHARQAVVLTSGEDAVAAVARVCRAEGATEVVVGMPIGLSGADTAQTAEVRRLALALRKNLEMPVTLFDERLSSVEAERTVKGADRRRRGEVDSAAAAIILQAVLDRRRQREMERA